MMKLSKTPEQGAFFRYLKSMLKRDDDAVMWLLRAHLYSEARLEDLIQVRLPRGKVVNERARLSYYQKLILVQALNVVEPSFIAALEALNKVRNEFAHDIDKDLTVHDVLRIGNPLGKHFESAKQKTGSDTVRTMRSILSLMCGNLDGALLFLKDPPKSRTITKKKSS